MENGTSKLSELEMINKNDDVGAASGVTDVGVRKEERGRRTSQKSPVHPAKHRQM